MDFPDTLAAPLEVPPSAFDTAQMNFLLTGLVIPRVIGWISTISAAGVPNLAPYSFFTVASTEPPHLLYSAASATKDSVVNARETGQFVANIADQALVDALVASSAAVAPSVDEFQYAGLRSAPSARVRPPRVAMAKAHLECEVRQFVSVGSSTLVIGEIVHIHVDPAIWAGGRVQPNLLNPVARLGGSSYATLADVFSRPGPTINERG
ncbi:MAG: flavin reductase family protein [Hyphomicrobiales bacterium]|nr:flavin reductase family protein [Hyphomicrobiales bacterium]